MFNLPTLTPIASAEHAPLYDAFTYLSSCEAINEYSEKLK